MLGMSGRTIALLALWRDGGGAARGRARGGRRGSVRSSAPWTQESPGRRSRLGRSWAGPVGHPREMSAFNPKRTFASCVYSITLSARSRIEFGILIPSVLAVFRLTTRSNLVGCSTGKSAGLAPFKILSTYVAALRNNTARSTP
jgi:hypothetical protein